MLKVYLPLEKQRGYAVVSLKVRSVMDQIIYTLFNISTLMRKGDRESIAGKTIFNFCFFIVVVGFIWLRNPEYSRKTTALLTGSN
jgi:hypothetical protein